MIESSYFFLNTELEDLERFDISRFLLLDNGVHDPMTANIFDEIPNLPLGGRFIVQGDGCRPDNVSFKIYGGTQYWWILLLYNRLQSFTEIKHGDELLYPSINDIEDYYFTLKTRQVESDRE